MSSLNSWFGRFQTLMHMKTQIVITLRREPTYPPPKSYLLKMMFLGGIFFSSPEDTLFSHNHGCVENGCTFERSRYILSFTEPWLWQQGYLHFQLILSQSFLLSISMTNFSNVYYSITIIIKFLICCAFCSGSGACSLGFDTCSSCIDWPKLVRYNRKRT